MLHPSVLGMAVSLTWGAREDLRHMEGLGQEALDLASARHGQLVLLTQLVHAQNGNDVLQVLVVLQGQAELGSAGACGSQRWSWQQ